MSDESQDRRLCNISTLWSVVALAHAGTSEAARAAQHRLLERYGGAIRRYLTASLRMPAAAEELFQEFTLRFLGGDFRLADPQRGRFRDYVKTSLVHLVGHYYKQLQRQPRSLNPTHPEPIDEAPATPRPGRLTAGSGDPSEIIGAMTSRSASAWLHCGTRVWARRATRRMAPFLRGTRRIQGPAAVPRPVINASASRRYNWIANQSDTAV